jgi:hypothetical protein
MKKLLFLLTLVVATAGFAAENHTQVLLEPIDAARTNLFDWKVVVMRNAMIEGRSTSDIGDLRVNLDLARLFRDGYAIYSITHLFPNAPSSPSFMIVLVRPKH